MRKFTAVFAIASIMLTGCVTTQGNMVQGNSGYSQSQTTNLGKVVSVREFTAQKNDPNYLALAGGALVGGLLGNQVGGGSGKKVATVAGAAGGAYVANEYTKKTQNVTMVELQVRDDNGQTYTITQEKNAQYYNGMRVRVNINGNTGTVTPQ
jgi:outer membrane lipoprotein SlyB